MQDARVKGLQAHLRLEGHNGELAYGDGAAWRKKGSDTPVWVAPFRVRRIDITIVPAAIIFPWSKALFHGERALKELAAAAHGTRRVPLDIVDWRVWCELISLSCPNLLLK
jgi:hypothetical protein